MKEIKLSELKINRYEQPYHIYIADAHTYFSADFDGKVFKLRKPKLVDFEKYFPKNWEVNPIGVEFMTNEDACKLCSEMKICVGD